jgi:hypothetical protein
MSVKRIFSIFGFLLIFGVGFGITFQQNPAQEKNQSQEKYRVRNGVKNEERTPLQNRLMFRDENGDGICDSFKDHDNDGIPNGQDPDWPRAKDGKGNQSRYGDKNSDKKHGFKNGQSGRNKWSSRTFRQNRAGAARNVCGRSGLQGNSKKSGRQ